VITSDHSFERAIAGYPLATRRTHVTKDGLPQFIEGDGVEVYVQDMDPRGAHSARPLYRDREIMAHKGDWDGVANRAAGGTRFWKRNESDGQSIALADRIEAACDLDVFDPKCLEGMKNVVYMPGGPETVSPGLHGVQREMKEDALNPTKPTASTKAKPPESTRSF
jgi:hypothetical protein